MALSGGLRTSLAGWAAALGPLFRARAPTTATTPTGREGNVSPPIAPTYSYRNQPSTQASTKPGGDPTALWGNNDLRQFDDTFTPGSLFGPSRPVVPNERENVRLRDYPVGYNLSYRPRSYQSIGFAELRALARETVMVRLAIETRKDQIERLDWAIKPKDEKAAPASAVKRAADAEKFWHKPDGVQSFAGWLREVMEEVLVTDAPALEVRRNRGGDLLGLDIIDGSTLKVLIDETGRWPKPPAPAYLQVIHGRPWRLLTSDQLIYAPRNRAVHSPYGSSPTEQTLLIANIALRRSLKQLAHFTEGNVPAGMITGGEGWTPEALKTYFEWLNSELGGNVANQTRLYLAPFGAKYQTFHEAPYKDTFDEWLARIISYAFSLPPTWAVAQVNRATAESAQEAAIEEGRGPIMAWVKRLIDDVIQVRMGQSDLEFVWADEAETDPSEQATMLVGYVKEGIYTRNEARDLLGLDAIDGGDDATVDTGQGPVLVADLEALSSVTSNPPQPVMAPSPNAASGRGSSGGKPAPGKPGAGKPPPKTNSPANKPPAANKPAGARPAQSRKKSAGAETPFFPTASDIAELLSKKAHVAAENAIATTLPLADPVLEADVQHRAWALVRKDQMQLDERDVPTASLMACGQTVVDRYRVNQETMKWLKRGGQGKFRPLVMEHSGMHVILSGLHHSQAAVNAGAAEMRVQVMSDKDNARKAGAATLSMDEADYTEDEPDDSEVCAECSMFRSPDSCTLVRGDISPLGTCRYFAAS